MANFNFNKVILGGRLTADPELKTTPSGVAVTTFSIAVNRRYAKEGEETKADFFNVTAWRGLAEFITKYFRKASSIVITGSLQTRNWVDDNGQKHYATEIVADEAYFVDSKNESAATAQNAAPVAEAVVMNPTVYMPDAYKTAGPNLFEEIKDDEELPF